MNQFDFFKRFPTENDAIDLSLRPSTRTGMYARNAGAYTAKSIINATTIETFTATTARVSFPL